MMKDKYTILDASNDIWDVETKAKQVTTLIRTVNETFYENDYVITEMSDAGMNLYMEDAKNLTAVALDIVFDIQDMLVAIQEKLAKNLNTEVGEVSA